MSSTDISPTGPPAVEPTGPSVIESTAASADEPTNPLQMDPDQLMRMFSRNWGVLLALGIVMGGLGVAILVWPGITIGVLAILTGIAMIVSGIFSLVGSFTAPDNGTGTRVLMAISGALSIIIGFVAFQSITHAVVILAVLTGISWLIRGILELVAGIGSPGQKGRGLMIALGVLSLIGGVAVLVWPGVTLLVLAVFTGVWLLIFAVLQIVASFKLRKMAQEEAPVAA